MPDREEYIVILSKTIKTIKELNEDIQIKINLGFAEDILELLKEQEAVAPILIREGPNKNYNDYVCPRCDNDVVYEQNYCSECGVQFLWEGR
jgi:hypothetical protein